MDQIFLRFDPSSVLTSAILPLAIAGGFLLLFIASLMSPGAKPAGVGKAAYCYSMQAFGIFLMSAGGLPALYGVTEKIFLKIETYSTETYLALLLLFATGGLLFLWHEQIAEKIDSASSAVCAVLFWFTFKAVGLLLMLFSGLSLLLTMLLVRPLPTEWWVQPSVLLVYGLLLSWCTRMPRPRVQSFSSTPMMTVTKAVLHTKKHKKGLSLPRLRRA